MRLNMEKDERFDIAIWQARIKEWLESKIYGISNICQGKTSLNLGYDMNSDQYSSFGSSNLIT